MSHPFLTTYQKTAQTSRDIFYNIPHNPNSLNSRVHKICLTIKSCVYSPIFLARSQPRLSLVYLKSIPKKPNLHKIIWMYDGPHLLCLKINTKLHQKKMKPNEMHQPLAKKFKLSRHPKVWIHTQKRKLLVPYKFMYLKNREILEMQKPVIEIN